MTPDRRLAAILSADIEGYSRLMADDEDATVRTLRSRREQVSTLISEHRGTLADFTGDNFLALFPAALDAVKCALKIQRVIDALNHDLPEHRRMRFRIGAHLGDVREENGRYFGDGVNVAARLQPLAEPGGLCLSSTLLETIRGRLDLKLSDLGIQKLKNIDSPVHAWGVTPGEPARPNKRNLMWLAAAALVIVCTAAAVAWFFRTDSSSTITKDSMSPIRSLAVLPLDNLSGDSGQDYLADSMTETLIAELSKLPDVRVVSRTSVMQFKDRSTPTPEIAVMLNVDGIIEGSIMRSGDRIRVTTQLIDARHDRHLWAEQHDRDLSQLFEIQSEIAQAVARQIAIVITPELQQRLKAPRAVPAEAQDAYLRGLAARQHLENRSLREAIRHLRTAIDIDPEFVNAWSALSAAYGALIDFGATLDDRPAILDEQLQSARKSLELDDGSGDAYMAFGYALYRRGDWQGAESAMRRGLELGATDQMLSGSYAFLLLGMNRRPEAYAFIETLVLNAPLDVALRSRYLALLSRDRERLDDALLECDRVLKLDPRSSLGFHLCRGVHEVRGDFEAALQVLRAHAQIEPGMNAIAKPAMQGWAADGANGYWRAFTVPHPPFSNEYVAAFALAQIGKLDDAVGVLEHLRDKQALSLSWISVEPLLEPLHGHPRFRRLVEDLKLPMPPSP